MNDNLIMLQAIERLKAKNSLNLTTIDPVDWIEHKFYIPELRAPMKVAPYQARALREALKIENGQFKYSTIIWGEIKKSAKTSISAGIMDWFMSNHQYASGKFVANSLEQASSRASKMLNTNFQIHPRDGVEVIPSRNLVRYPNNSEVKSIPINPSAEAGGNDSIVAFDELWGAHEQAKETMWCFDQETEILTLDGWKDHKSFGDNSVACYNPETDGIEWHSPTGFYRERYKGKMHLYGGEKFSHCVTPNHRLYGIFSQKGKKSGKSQNGIMRSDELRESTFGIFHPKTSVSSYESFDTPEYKEFGSTKFKEGFRVRWEDWCEYVGWFVSEGYVRHNKKISGEPYPTQVNISQDPKANPREWEQIRALHQRMFGDNVGFRIADKDKAFIVHSSEVAKECLKMGNTSYEKQVPFDVKNTSIEGLSRFFESYILGDGQENEAGSPLASTHSKQLADDLMEIGLRLGYRTSIRHKFLAGYRLTFATDDGYGHEVSKRHGDWKEIDYDGIVWCPSVPTGIIVTRRHGTVCISGNTEMTLSPTRYGKSFRLVTTYAGYLGESNLLWTLYQQGVDQYAQFPGEGKRFDWCDEFDPPLECYYNEAARLFCLWNTVPRLSWQTPEYYAQESSILIPSEFNRVHRNQWSAAVEAFVPIEWWDACRVKPEDMPPVDQDTLLIVGVDAAVSQDCFGIIGVSRHGDKVAIRYIGEWKPPRGGKIQFVNEADPDDLNYPEGVCRWLYRNYNVIEFAYDQTHLAEMTGRLQRAGFGLYKVFSQGRDRLVSDKVLYDMIARKGIMHDGDPRLRSHIQNANAELKGDKSMRLVKRAPSLHIDLAVALSMSVQRALHYRIG